MTEAKNGTPGITDDPNVRIGFILTHEGRAWSDEGLAFATGMVNEAYPSDSQDPDDGILWTTGARINEPAFLAALLRTRPDAFVILSMQDGSALIPNDDGLAGNDIADLLESVEDPGRTSWSVLVSVWKNAEKEAARNA